MCLWPSITNKVRSRTKKILHKSPHLLESLTKNKSVAIKKNAYSTIPRIKEESPFLPARPCDPLRFPKTK